MALSGASAQRLRVRPLGLLQALGHEVGVAEVEQDGDVAGILPAPLLELGDVVAGSRVPVLAGVVVRALRPRLVLVDGDGRVSGGEAAACRRLAGAPADSAPPELMPTTITAAATATATPTAMRARDRLTLVLPWGTRSQAHKQDSIGLVPPATGGFPRKPALIAGATSALRESLTAA